MTRDSLRVLVPAMFALASIIAATLLLDWFIIDFRGSAEISKITFDLREARACTTLGPCAVVPMSMIKGSAYPTLAAVTFWGGLLFAAVVLYQCGTRLLNGTAGEAAARIGHVLGVVVMLTAAGCGYLFGPDLEAGAMMGFGVDRGLGPLVMLVGLVAGHVALRATREGRDEPAYTPIEPQRYARTPTAPPPVVGSTRVPLPMHTPSHGVPTVRPPTVPPPTASRTKTPTRGQTPTAPPPMKAMPEALKGKLRFSMVTGEISVAGIDARREDGSGVLVMWRDVVGLVVRRLPPELEGHPFADVVSTAGMTLRVLPWSKLTGESFGEADAETRVRELVKLVTQRCPEAKLDRATQAFVEDATRRPAQLPNLEMLAKHDQALA